MAKFTFDKGVLLSVASIALSIASAVAKSKYSEHKKQVEKEEWIKEAMERFSKKGN